VQDVSEHVHEWRRLPIVSLSVTYICACTEAATVMWTSALSQNIEALDAEFAKHHGGRFAGEMHPAPGADHRVRPMTCHTT
jgi:hypothetical protein